MMHPRAVANRHLVEWGRHQALSNKSARAAWLNFAERMDKEGYRELAGYVRFRVEAHTDRDGSSGAWRFKPIPPFSWAERKGNEPLTVSYRVDDSPPPRNRPL